MYSRLYFAFFISLALHGVVFYPGLLKLFAASAPRQVLQASLRLPTPPAPAIEKQTDDPLIKNTMDSNETKQAVKPAPQDTKPIKENIRSQKQEIAAAQRKISEHIFYPQQAIDEGLEGDVWLILKLSEDGSILDVSVATSSGHKILDNAAIKAAYAMGRQKGSHSAELIVPVHFRLE